MHAPTDNIIKSTSIPDQIIKLKTTKKESPDISKCEFDKELQDKFKTTIKGIDDFEHKMYVTTEDDDDIADEQIPTATDTKIECDSKTAEKLYKEDFDELIKDNIRSTTAQFLQGEIQQSKNIQAIINNASRIPATIAATATAATTATTTTTDKLDKSPIELIDPQLASKLSAQMKKTEMNIEDIQQQQKQSEIKKNISDELLDPELSVKLSVQKEKVEREQIIKDDKESTKTTTSKTTTETIKSITTTGTSGLESSDDIYKTIEEKITKKMSQDFTSIKDEFDLKGKFYLYT